MKRNRKYNLCQENGAKQLYILLPSSIEAFLTMNCAVQHHRMLEKIARFGVATNVAGRGTAYKMLEKSWYKDQNETYKIGLDRP